MGGRPQPVVLEIFEDAFLEEIEEDKLPILNTETYRAIEKPSIKDDLVEKALDLLLEGKKPLIVFVTIKGFFHVSGMSKSFE